MWTNVLLIISVLLGASVAYFMERRSEWWTKWRPLIISFGGSFLLGITILVLFPQVYDVHDHSGNPTIDPSYFVIAGFLLQLILEAMSGGIEHGHIHGNTKLPLSSVLTVFLGLSIHSILEGMPIHGLHDHSHTDSNSYLWGIFVHKFPAAFALMSYLLMSAWAKWKIWLIIILFSIMTPLGSWIGDLMNQNLNWQEYLPYVAAMVTGSFLHIATVVLFEFGDNSGHKISISKLAMILLGISLAVMIH